MSSNAVRWLVGTALAVVGVVLVGDLVLIGLIPILMVASAAGVLHLTGSGREAAPDDLQRQVRRLLVEGEAGAAAGLLVPLLNARSAGTRRYAAEMLTLAVQAGADDGAVLDALPRLTELAPTFRIGRALLAHGRVEAAIEVLSGAADGHDPVAWAEYIGAVARAGRDDDLARAVASGPLPPPIEAVLLAARRLDPDQTLEVRQALTSRLGASSPPVLVLDAAGSDPETALAAFIETNQANPDPEAAAWVAWSGAMLGSAVAREHLERIIGRAASARTAVAIMLAAVHAGRPEVALRIGPTALRSARGDVRPALHLAHAQALAAAGRPEDAVGALHSIPIEMALVAVVTPPLRDAVRTAESWPILAERIVTA